MSENEFIKHLTMQSDNAWRCHKEFSIFLEYIERVKNSDFISNIFSTHGLKEINKIWFDMEIVNALALDEWQNAGQPENWQSEWNSNFLPDVKSLIFSFNEALMNQGYRDTMHYLDTED